MSQLPSSLVSSPTPFLLPAPTRTYTTAELLVFAQFLANEMNGDAGVAAGHPPAWYAHQIGGELPHADAERLRRQTLVACWQIGSQPVVLLETSERAAPAAGWNFAAPVAQRPVDELLSGSPGVVRDEPANRARRAKLMGSLPGRVQAGVIAELRGVDEESETWHTQQLRLSRHQRRVDRMIWFAVLCALLLGVLAVFGVWS